MSKVLVDPAALEEAAKWLEVHSSSSGSAEAFAAEALREAIAQPAEAEGVDFGFDDRSVRVSQEAYSIFLARERHHLAALSAVTAERDRLRDAAGKAIAWLDAEQNESGVGINRRIKLCRDAENSLRAAVATQAGEL